MGINTCKGRAEEGGSCECALLSQEERAGVVWSLRRASNPLMSKAYCGADSVGL
jgi:hypothetical protein